MASSAIQAIKNEIDRKQSEIDALKAALTALTGSAGPRSVKRKGTRRPRTAAEKAATSKAMKAAWRRRKAGKSRSAVARVAGKDTKAPSIATATKG